MIISAVNFNCENPEKPKVLKRINGYEKIVLSFQQSYNEIKRDSFELQYSNLLKLQKSFDDTINKKFIELKNIIVLADFSGNDREEVLKKFAESQKKVYKLCSLLKKSLADLEMTKLDSLYSRTIQREKELLYFAPHVREALSQIASETKTKVDIRRREIKYDIMFFVDSINLKLSELNESNENILK
jgi:hypothetical protein